MDQERAPRPSERTAGASSGMSRGWSLSTFRQGVDAAKAGQPATANPYHENSDQAVIWLGGWQVGTSM